MATTHAPYDPSYREEDVDSTLDEHEGRITNLERAALVGGGYLLAKGSGFVTDLAQFL